MSDIYEPQIEKIPVGLIKLDPDNPNQMNPEQMKGLEKSLRDFGNVVPVVVDQDNMIIDGEHRLLVYRDRLGLKEIPAFRINTTDPIKRKLMRQTLNKLKGFIDPEKDVLEMIQIQESNMIEDLSSLIAIDTHNIERLIESVTNPVISAGYEALEAEGGGGGDKEQYEFKDEFQGQDYDDNDTILHTPPAGSNSPYMLTFHLKDVTEYEYVVGELRKINPKSMKEALMQLLGERNRRDR